MSAEHKTLKATLREVGDLFDTAIVRPMLLALTPVVEVMAWMFDGLWREIEPLFTPHMDAMAGKHGGVWLAVTWIVFLWATWAIVTFCMLAFVGIGQSIDKRDFSV